MHQSAVCRANLQMQHGLDWYQHLLVVTERGNKAAAELCMPMNLQQKA